MRRSTRPRLAHRRANDRGDHANLRMLEAIAEFVLKRAAQRLRINADRLGDAARGDTMCSEDLHGVALCLCRLK